MLGGLVKEPVSCGHQQNFFPIKSKVWLNTHRVAQTHRALNFMQIKMTATASCEMWGLLYVVKQGSSHSHFSLLP